MTKTYSFELSPNSEFDFDDGYIITFSSDNLDHLQEVSDQLSFLEQTTIS